MKIFSKLIFAKLRQNGVVSSQKSKEDNEIYKDVFISSDSDIHNSIYKNKDIKITKSNNKKSLAKNLTLITLAGISLFASFSSAYAGDINSNSYNIEHNRQVKIEKYGIDAQKYSKEEIKKTLELLEKIKKHKNIVKLELKGNKLIIDKPWYAGGKVEVPITVSEKEAKKIFDLIMKKINNDEQFTLSDAIAVLSSIDYKQLIA